MQAHAPDGLTESDIDALLAEVDAEVQPLRRPTTAFVGMRSDQMRTPATVHLISDATPSRSTGTAAA